MLVPTFQRKIISHISSVRFYVYTEIHPENSGSMLLRNVGNYL